MKAKSFFEGISSWVLSFMTFSFSTIFMFAIGYPLETYIVDGVNIGDWITYISTGILIAIACFFICKKFPNSVWSALIICNALGIFGAFVEPNFWIGPMWKQNLVGWILSSIGALIGAWIGSHPVTKVHP